MDEDPDTWYADADGDGWGDDDLSCDFAAYVYSGLVEGTLEASDATARTDNEYLSAGGALASADLNGDGADDLVWSWWNVFESSLGYIQTDIFYGGP